MKIHTKIIAVCSLAFAMATSCTEDFGEMNTPKDLITEEVVQLDMLFARVLARSVIVNEETGFGTVGNWSGMSISGANRPFEQGEDNTVWDRTYTDYIRNLSDIIHISTRREDADNLVNQRAVARILKVWVFAKATDTYGDIPYFESALPVEQAVKTPKYDSQRDIYLDLFKELKEAVAELDDAKPKFTNADFLYGGDLGKWKKFANSLRLRLALRVRYADETMAREQMADLEEEDLITTRDDDASIYNIDDYPDHENPRYRDLVARKATVVKPTVPKTFLDILKNNNDPRLAVFADTARAEFPQTPGYEHIDYFGYRGRPLIAGEDPGASYAFCCNSTSQWSDLLYVQIQEQPLYKSSETYFNLAEAALFELKGSPQDAQPYFKMGIQRALEHTKALYEDAIPQLPEVVALFGAGKPEAEIESILQSVIDSKAIKQADIDAFLQSDAVVLTGSDENKLEQIINQKMVAFFPMEHEAWADYRRTGYPRVQVGGSNLEMDGKMPRRIIWPGAEQLLNGEQYQIARQNLGGEDKRTSRFWWDANPDPFKPHPDPVERIDLPWEDWVSN